MQREDVGARDQSLERQILDVGPLGVPAAGHGHAHTESRGPRRDRPSDAAAAHDAQELAGQAAAQHEIEAPSLPRARAHKPLAFAEPSRDGQDEGPGEIRRRIRQHIRRVRAVNPLRRGVRHIEVVVADGDVGDDLQRGPGRVDGRAVDAAAQEHDDTGLALEPLVQLLDGQRQLTRVQVDVMVRGQAGNRGARKAAGDEDGGHRQLRISDCRLRITKFTRFESRESAICNPQFLVALRHTVAAVVAADGRLDHTRAAGRRGHDHLQAQSGSGVGRGAERASAAAAPRVASTWRTMVRISSSVMTGCRRGR